jgi:hypothetical protein
MNTFRKEDLAASEKTPEVVNFILNPPFGIGGRMVYRLLANAAISTIDANELKILGLKPRSKYWRKITRQFLNVFIAILGGTSPSQNAAIERCNRVRQQSHQ